MKHEILILGVVGLLIGGFAKADVDKVVGKTVSIKNCVSNPVHTIQCKGQNFFDSTQNYFLNIEYQQPCYYRHADYGHWDIELKLQDQQNLILVAQMSNRDIATDLSLDKFSKDSFNLNEPFEINLFKSKGKYSIFEIKKIEQVVTNKCKPGSALTDDYCQTTCYIIENISHHFRDMECIANIKK